MKITFSKRGDERGRHVVLVCDNQGEANDAEPVIATEILKGKVRPYKEQFGRGKIVFRFSMKYLDRIALAFPFAELSEGVHRKLMRAEEVRLEGFEVPKLKIPGFTGKLYDFQKIAVALLTDPDYARAHGYTGIELDPNSILKLHHPGGVIDFLNDEMGLGKTYIILAVIAVLQAYPALIAVPNNTKYTWAEVIEEFFPKLTVGVYDTQTQSRGERAALLAERRDITLVNIEAIRATAIHEGGDIHMPIIGYDYDNPELFDFEYEYAVLDEHHRVKTPYAQVTNGFFQLNAGDWWCPMSGTPILNRIEEIWTVLHKRYPDLFPSYERFISALCVKDGDRVVAYKVEAMAELKAFMSDRSLRRRKDQVAKDLPEVVFKPVRVVLSAEERKIYDRIEQDLILEMEDGTVKNIGGALPQITRMKQACFSPELFGGTPKSSKIDELKRIVSELVASGEKAVIFSQWSTACDIMRRELAEWNPAYVTGKVASLKKRQEQIRKFNEDDDCHIYIGTIGANREGVNLGAATYVIFTDEGWTPAGNDQAIGRSAAGGLRGAHHAKGTVVTVIVMQAEDTYEQNVEAMLKKKRAVFNRTMERDGGKAMKVEKVSLIDLYAALSSKGKKKLKVKGKKSSGKKKPS